MIGHDLIEQVGGIEKAKAIVVGASFGTHYRVDTGEVICCHNESHFYFTDLVKLGVEFIRIDDLHTAIAQYEQGSNPSGFKVNDQVVLINKPGSSNSLHRVLEVRHPTTIVVCPINQVSGNDLVILQFCASPYYLRHITGDEFDAGHRIDKKIESDDVRDICNHISSNMKVVEL